MSEFAKEVLPVNLEDEMRQSYLDYAMSVIVGRALPDVRDGLKPVHRRVLYAMSVLGNDWNKPYKKSARVVGDVIGKYHPHGDTAVYDTIVRMAQPFSMRYMLVDGQGNFGSVDGDAPAAMRYTEVRMAKIAHSMLDDLDKETVDFVPNYDNSEHEPAVLPARIPNLLINGSTGIAVGMATNIPPHNLGEVIDACIALVDNEAISMSELMQYLPGPDFPTAAIINGAHGIKEAYRTGRGRIYMRARTEIESLDSSSRQRIIVHELPYQVNKARLLEKIAELVKEKKIEGITELRDESDKDGMRMVIELRRGEVAEVVLNNLFQQTAMQNVFGINMVALVDGQPRLLNLKQMLEYFIRHRREVVTRRTLFELRKARDRAHVLEGLAVALANIDEVIALIKAASSPAEAKLALLARHWQSGTVEAMLQRAGADSTRPEGLALEFGLSKQGYRLTEIQAQAILDLRLHRLTGLEQDKIIKEYEELLEKIANLLDILSSSFRLMEVIRDELLAIREQYNDPRRTQIIQDRLDLTLEDLITEEDVVVTLSHKGYAKAQPISVYQAQRRGGKGKSATATKDEDFVDKLFVASTHDTILCFSSHGKVYWLKVYELPQAGRGARGKPMVNLLPLGEEERINAILPVREFPEDRYVFMATRSGIVKKTPLEAFSRPRASGIIAVDLRPDDRLIGVEITDGDQHVMLFASSGKAVRFHESHVRPMGRTACGVRGIKFAPEQQLVSLIVGDQGDILTVTENGFGKRTPVAQYPVHGRGGMGVISVQTSERNGPVVGAVQVQEDDEIMMITNGGTLVRTPVRDVSQMGRNTQGVTMIRLGKAERLIGIERIENLEEEQDAGGEVSDGASDESVD
ncbi:DNA gyrase subunit A [endosymbiont of Ridgeia piscesae]|jgi:DNA gyrase subunit A|uniref:DNA gyrase subunit A n=1 Tax=endosymbiont of Ridgeia piscesae TaxID=54398 RepID=A0A0T5YZ87_9GAMM|nr:DNA gyrase subunit A [endosymbiont of Ridgeia piscesae]KRT55959.1 DNA gyrase subunit A [endosymbiont of Ridgeia piscesae]KRT59959.1 DNA gyrase subunit A [endosymbiont of Ridgeia piscesae]